MRPSHPNIKGIVFSPHCTFSRLNDPLSSHPSLSSSLSPSFYPLFLSATCLLHLFITAKSDKEATSAVALKSKNSDARIITSL